MLGFIYRHFNAKKIEADRDKFHDILISLRSKNDSLDYTNCELKGQNNTIKAKVNELYIENDKLTNQNNALRDEMNGVRAEIRAENKRIDELYEENARLKTEIARLTAALGSEPRVLSEDDIDAVFAAVSPELE